MSEYTSTIFLSNTDTHSAKCQAGGGVDDAYCTKSHLQTPQVIVHSRNHLVNPPNLPKPIHSPLGDLVIARRFFLSSFLGAMYKLKVIYRKDLNL